MLIEALLLLQWSYYQEREYAASLAQSKGKGFYIIGLLMWACVSM